MLYLGTTIASWILMTIASKAIYGRLKEEGYEFIPKKKTKAEERQEKAKVILVMLLPVINILFSGFVTLAFDKVYEIVKESWIRDGKAKKIENNEETKNEDIDIDLNSKDMNKTRKYSELSNEEKLRILEEERKSLLKEKEPTEPYNYKGAYTKSKQDK